MGSLVLGIATVASIRFLVSEMKRLSKMTEEERNKSSSALRSLGNRQGIMGDLIIDNINNTINQERKLEDRRRSDTVLVLTINDVD